MSFENITYLKGENKNVDANWKKGISDKNIKDDKDDKIVIIVVSNILPAEPKTMAECKGSVTADYQVYLEKEWLSYLKNKYTVKLNNDVLNTVK